MGFSLLEVLVALAVMSMSLAVLYATVAGVVRSAGEAERHAHALALANSLLALYETIPQGGVDRRGEHEVGGEPLRWRLAASPLHPAAVAGRSSGTPAMSDARMIDSRRPDWPLYRTEVWVRWKWGARERELHLVTLRLEQPVPIQEQG